MSVYPIILSQDQFLHHDKLKYPYNERGLQFGDGVYEVIRIYKGQYYLLEEHINRLYRSAEAIKIELNIQSKDLINLLQELLAKNTIITDAIVYLQVTRGSASRNHLFPDNLIPNLFAYIQDQPRLLEQLDSGVQTITARDIRWESCFIKSLNLLPNVLAKQEAKEANCHEAILHKDGIVTECSASNVYLVKHGNIYTFPATKRILNGCVRMLVKELANDLEIPFIEEAFSVEDISVADELFLTSSISEVLPIVKVDNHKIANGKPGEVTRLLQNAYETAAGIRTNKINHTN